MKQESREELDAYYRDAESWAKDQQDELRRSRRIAWLVAAGAGTVAVFEAVALILLTPLKTVVPYTLLVDRHTGYVQALRPVEPERITGDAALTQSFLVQYVIARESFDIDSIQADYRKVALWSDGPARADYIARMQSSSPDSPIARYPRSTVVETRVKSVSSIGERVALVRFETRRRDAGGQAGPPQAWASVIRYRYSGEPLAMADRLLNPLGFEVLRYRRDAEALPPEPDPTPTQLAPSELRQVPVLRRVPGPVAPAPPPPTPPTPEIEL